MKKKHLFISISNSSIILAFIMNMICQIRIFYYFANEAKAKEHLFIYQSFIFAGDDSKIHDPKSQRSPATLVTLFLADKTYKIYKNMGCSVLRPDSIGYTARPLKIRIESIISLGLCQLDLFVLTCPIKQKHISKELEVTLTFNPPQGLIPDSRLGNKMVNSIKIKPNLPDYKPRKLVMCISRIFAFEKWQLFLTAIETYRQFRVDLIVTHIYSAITPIFELMKLYEAEGLLRVKPGVRFPFLDEMEFNPNAETEFNGQILHAHECFYEFRESANFIALIDWDDLLVTSTFATLGEAFSSAALKFPNAAYFMVNKLESSYKEQDADPRKFSIKRLVKQGLLSAQMYNDEKMVIRPKWLRGFWMHNSPHLEAGGQAQLSTNYSIIVHLANDERVYQSEFNMPFLESKVDLDQMERNVSIKMAKMNAMEELDDLPRKKVYGEAIYECHKKIFIYHRANNTDVCLSYNLCELPRLQISCTVARSDFESTQLTTGLHAVYLRRHSMFHNKNDGCSFNNRLL